MIDHLELRTRDIPANLRFYADLLGPLGYTLKVDAAAKGLGNGISLDLFLAEGEPSTNVHYAFAAPDRATVDRIHDAGLAAGHALDRAPELAPHIHPNYYAGYFRDPDGRLVEFVCQQPEA